MTLLLVIHAFQFFLEPRKQQLLKQDKKSLGELMTGKELWHQNRIPLSEVIINGFFTICITVFAVWVIITQTSLLIGVSFLNLCIVFSIIIIPVLLLFARKYSGALKYSSAIMRDNELHTIIILLLLALIGAAISVAAIVYSPDDVNYISRAIYFLKNCNESLDLKQHDHGLIQFPMISALNIFRTMEFFCAYLAFILHLPFLHIYHLFLPALGGAMIPLAWFLAFSKFSKRTMVAALAAMAVCVFLSIDGSPHRSFGNYAFVRIWQNKCLFMSIFVPLFIAFSLDFFRTPIFLHWNRLFLLLIACAGLSPMTSFFMPFMGVLLGFSWWWAQGIRSQDSFKKILMFSAAYVYLLLIAFYCFINANRARLDYLGSFRYFPKTFIEQFKLVFIDFWSYPSVTFLLFTVLSIVVVERSYRKFLIVWIILCVTLFLNPIVFPFVSKVTTYNTYWRLFYLLPFPLVIGLPMTFLDRANKLRAGFAYMVFLGLLLVSIIGNLWPHQYATFGKVPFAFGQYKIDPHLEAAVKKMISVSKPGPMLAPYSYGAVIPMYSPDFPQVCVREFTLKGFSIQYGKIKESNIKFGAIKYISGKSKEGLENVLYLIRKGLVNIVLDIQVTTWKDWRRFSKILARYGFECVEKNRSFLVYTRNER
jgi:hypothetical protein